jgi:cytochrome c oxidase assembly protein subunit 15
MTEVDLYNLSPTARLLCVGFFIAVVPLFLTLYKNRGRNVNLKMRALVVLTLFLTFDLVMFGSFTRLTDSGLGCPDWPGCYGHASPIGADDHIDAAVAAMPTGPVTHNKAWIEMIHRYLAMSVGFLILVLAVVSTWQKFKGRVAEKDAWQVRPFWAWLTLVWVCMQGAFGALTVTMKLFPAIVTLHLLGGIGLLVLLSAQVAWVPSVQREVMSARLRAMVWLAAVLLVIQIALGAWVSTNYAVLACTGFPDCNGQWWPAWNGAAFQIWRHLGVDAAGQNLPFEALQSVHMVHRVMALVVFTYGAFMLWSFKRNGVLKDLSRWLAALLALQFLTGLSNVVLDWPLLAAVAHTGGAGALMMVLTWMLSRTRAPGR